jgi:hypothetical protein
MWKLRSLILGAALLASPVFAGTLEEALEQGFVQSCQRDRMFKGLEEMFDSTKLPFSEKKACSCVARKILADSRVISGLLDETKDSGYAKLAVMAYTAQCLSLLAEEGMGRLRQ